MSSITSTNSAISSAQRILDVIKNEEEMAGRILARSASIRAISLFNRQNIVRSQAVAKAWKSIGRQVLAMHPEVVEEVKIATSDKISSDVLRVLPYMNPLVVFADPPVFDSWTDRHPQSARVKGYVSEETMRLLGFFTYGTIEALGSSIYDIDKHTLATNDPAATRFGMTLIFEALDLSGRVVDVELNSITIYFGQTETLAETVEAILTRFHWDTQAHATEKRKWMRKVLSTVIGSLFYLCSTTLEAEKVPAKTTRQLGRNVTRKPLSFYRIGWTTGAALTRYRQARTNSTSEQGDASHQMQDPQHRRAHFKMQPCGPGNAERKLIFVSPYWTRKDLVGLEGVNTARQVPRVNGKGSAGASERVAMEMANVASDS